MALSARLGGECARQRTKVADAAGQDSDVIDASAAIDFTQQAESVGNREVSTGEVDDD
jgi:hypothetical protein